jgi:hypothetical protein
MARFQARQVEQQWGTLSYFEIVFSVLTGFSVNFTLGKKAVGIYLGIYEDTYRSKGNMSTEVFDCVKVETDIVCNLQWSQNNGTWT